MTRPTDISMPPLKKRVETPTILQMESVECGAAALAIVLAYYGKWVPLEELRIACGVSRDGSKAGNITKAARNYGLNASGYKKSLDTLFALDPPFIVFWEFNHFIVVEGVKKGKVYVNDPSCGPRILSWDEFDRGYTGVAIALSPSPSFEKQGRRAGVFLSLSGRLKGSALSLSFIVLTSLLLVAPGLALPSFLRVFLDEIMIGRATAWFSPLVVGMVLTMILQWILTWVQQKYLTRLETKISVAASTQFFWHVLRLPVHFFSQRYAGEIGGRVQYSDTIAQLLSDQLALSMINIFMIVFYALVMLQYDVFLTLIGVVTAGGNLAFLRLMTRKRTDANQRLLQESGKVQGVAMAGIQMIETLKASGGENDFFSKWAGHQALCLNESQNLGLSVQYMNVIPQFFMTFNTALVYAMGGLRVMSGSMTIGELVAFSSLMMFFLSPVNQLVNLGGSLQDMRGMLGRVDDVLRYPEDEAFTEEPGAAPPEAVTFDGSIVLEDISFGYNPLEPPLIQDFSLSVQPGRKVAIIGGSGSGKSTVSRLIAGIHKPWTGRVLFSGVERERWPRQVITQSLAMVDQDIVLFEGSIRENLSLWDSSVSDDDLFRACRDADLHTLISTLPGGLESRIHEAGKNLSGGQRQRLEIARALSINPLILILDEATSALDPLTEMNVEENLRRRGCTCIVVAHRLSTIRDADEIIVMDKGRIVQRGTHESMKNADGPYARLISHE
jgi:NHLM bacteriocin system ABC transporter peptidase/ATP-binding protein